MPWNFQIQYSYLLNNIICRKRDNCDIYRLLNHYVSHIFCRSYGSWIYLCNQCLSPLKLWVRIPLIERCIHCINNWSYLIIGCYSIQHYVIVCQWHATGCWFSQDTPVSSTNKTDPHDIAEILLKMALNTIAKTLPPYYTPLCLMNIKCRDLIVGWLIDCCCFTSFECYFKYIHNENMFFFKQTMNPVG